MRYHKELARDTLKPREALTILEEGNARFVQNLRANQNLLQMVAETRKDQFPFAAILSCSDSRVPTELVFDQGLGDIFSVRLAGNIASMKAIASIEFACKYLGSKLIVVLGHTRCGGVAGACDGVEMGNLDAIFSDIRPAIEAETTITTDRHSKNPAFFEKIIHHNVMYQMQTMLNSSATIREMVEAEKVGMVGGYYDLDTGAVHFYEDTNIFSINCQIKGIQKKIAAA